MRKGIYLFILILRMALKDQVICIAIIFIIVISVFNLHPNLYLYFYIGSIISIYISYINASYDKNIIFYKMNGISKRYFLYVKNIFYLLFLAAEHVLIDSL